LAFRQLAKSPLYFKIVLTYGFVWSIQEVIYLTERNASLKSSCIPFLFMRLDVGCGLTPSGDVNCDLFIDDGHHRTRVKGVAGPRLEATRIRNFIVCDALHLPFSAGAFEEVVCNHVIEHVPSPRRLLDELLRVSSYEVTLHCPHGLGDRLEGRFDCHIHFFNRRWFVEAAKKLDCFVVTRVTREKTLPFNYFSLGFKVPLELEIKLWKKKP
jgi:SAM-dependent methyltransferase